jgi:hypothetical protein
MALVNSTFKTKEVSLSAAIPATGALTVNIGGLVKSSDSTGLRVSQPEKTVVPNITVANSNPNPEKFFRKLELLSEFAGNRV